MKCFLGNGTTNTREKREKPDRNPQNVAVAATDQALSAESAQATATCGIQKTRHKSKVLMTKNRDDDDDDRGSKKRDKRLTTQTPMMRRMEEMTQTPDKKSRVRLVIRTSAVELAKGSV